jgi:hypothetical protein
MHVRFRYHTVVQIVFLGKYMRLYALAGAAHLIVMLVDYAGLGVKGLDCRFVGFDMLV